MKEDIDQDAALIAALENHVPEIILALPVALAIIASGVTGLTCGLGGERSLLSLVVVPLLLLQRREVALRGPRGVSGGQMPPRRRTTARWA